MFHRRKLLPLYIAAALASGQAAAVGLGDLSLQSYLGKPLQAEVALSHMGDLTVDQLKVQIGSEADYSALGVEYNYMHSSLKIEPFVKNGQTYVRISTTESISEPYLNFVLNLRWPKGQVVREFTVLLDPAPETAFAGRSNQPQSATDYSAAASHPAVVAVVPVDDAIPAAAAAPREDVRPARTSRPAPQAEQRPVAAGSYVTQRGDSLWRLANRLRPSTAVSVEQMMGALLSANPQAFINGDASRLKEAVTIDVAAAERIALQGDVAPHSTTAVAAAETPTTTISPTPSPKAPSSSPANPAPSIQDSLVQENVVLKAQVADLNQNVSSLNASLNASTDRLHEMEARLDNLLQQFQQQRTGLAGQGAEPASGSAVAQPGAMINQVNAGELWPTPKAHTPWWVHLLYWSGIAAAAGWALREHFWPARRLALAGVGGDSQRVTPPVDRPAFGGAAQPVGRTVDREPQQTWQQDDDEVLSLDLGDILPLDGAAPLPTEIELDLPRQTEEHVDASISAGVFVAFGRFDEAERLLQEALQQNPERDDLRLQLLDVYLQSDQVEEFEILAEVIESGPASPETLAELAVLRDSYQSRG